MGPYKFEIIFDTPNQEAFVYGKDKSDAINKIIALQDTLSDMGMCPSFKLVGKCDEDTNKVKYLKEILEQDECYMDGYYHEDILYEKWKAREKLKELGVEYEEEAI